MRMMALLVVLALGLAGCATTLSNGNFLQASIVDQQTLAGDAVKQLAVLWPPAKTQFALQLTTPDTFGGALVKGLREKGYAVLEYGSGAATAKAVPLGYVLDQAGRPGLYRMTLTVGKQSIARAYLERNGALVPAGYWVRKE